MEHLRVGILEEDEVLCRGLVAILSEEGSECVVLGEREASPEAEAAEANLDVAVVCSKSLGRAQLSCPVILLAAPELAAQGMVACRRTSWRRFPTMAWSVDSSWRAFGRRRPACGSRPRTPAHPRARCWIPAGSRS